MANDDGDTERAANMFAWQETGEWLGNSNENPDPDKRPSGCRDEALILLVFIAGLAFVMFEKLPTVI